VLIVIIDWMDSFFVLFLRREVYDFSCNKVLTLIKVSDLKRDFVSISSKKIYDIQTSGRTSE
jgi:hypothetical protein